MSANREVQFLIVDDDEVDREAIRRAFKTEKILNNIFEAENGVEAFEFLKSKNKNDLQNNPIIVLLDLNMPKMNGLEFLSKLRLDEDLKRTIVFVISTSDDDDDKIKAYDFNVAGFVKKGAINLSISKCIAMLNTYSKIIEFPPY
ncbi:MAG: two-component system response regulator [Planctomycetota bacterium]|nr:MAG: two-component system response regulator [Planctomycetota bacterium]